MTKTDDKGANDNQAPRSSAARPSSTQLASFIDHTLLRADATEEEIKRLCSEAQAHQFKAVCVNPIFVRRTRQLLDRCEVLTASVVGFPLGASLTKVKCLETELAIQDGASEIDMVIRLDLIKEQRWQEAEADIRAVVRAAQGSPVKVILETGLLTTEQIARACQVSESAGAAFVKTATGFLGRGASVEDIALMRRSCSPGVQIKASGGIKTFEQAVELIAAGASRIGTSNGVALVTGVCSSSVVY